MRNRRRAGGLAGIAFLILAAHASASSLAWHLPEWRYRYVVSLLCSDPAKRINTGMIRLEEAPPRVREDGRDIRVLDDQGRAVAFQLVNGARQKIAGQAEPGVYLIHFRVDNPAVRTYLVYYGNPQAAPLFSDWDKHLGGLRLATYTHQKQTAPSRSQDMRSMLEGATKLGEGPRRQINDSENPFGPNDYFLSRYEGEILCPVDGRYSFATNSDDASFLFIDNDNNPAVQWPGGHSPAGSFEGARTGDVTLKAGIHRIEYLHAQAGGGSLAQAGWRPPGAAQMALIPEEAFVRELPTELIEAEDRQNPVSAFFSMTPVSAVRVGRGGPLFVTIAFKDLSKSRFGDIAVREWDFGDGVISGETAPTHTFAGEQPYTVALRVTDRLGFDARIERITRVAPERAVELEVDIEAALERSILRPDETPVAWVRCRVSGGDPPPMDLLTEIRNASGEVLRRDRESARLNTGEWRSFERVLANADAALSGGEALFQLECMGQIVSSRRVRVAEAKDPGLRLHATGGKILDAGGKLVALRLSGETLGREEWSLEDKLRDKRAIRLAVIDDSMCGAQNAYPEAVAGEVLQRLGKDNVEVRSFGGDAAAGPEQGLAELPERVREFAPDAVVVAASFRDVLRFTPVDKFERNLQALVERLRAVVRAEVVLLSTPPAMGNPGMSQAYAIAVKRVGMRERAPVADAFSAFVRAGETGSGGAQSGWQRFYRDENGSPLYYATHTREGQELIAKTVARTLCQKSTVGYDRR